MPAEAAVRFLDYRLREMEEQDVFRATVAMNTAFCGAGVRAKKPFDYLEQVDYIWERRKRDTRSAAEIIADTAASFGVDIV